MLRKKVQFCPKCNRYTECIYKGKNGEREAIIPIGVINTLFQIFDDDRSKFWECTKCGKIFED